MGEVVGEVDGLCVGAVVGAVEGPVVGTDVGEVDGLCVGAVVGAVEGAVVGADVGTDVVGAPVGAEVGAEVGADVGAEVGTAVVGAVDGAAVGAPVGAPVGAAVGIDVAKESATAAPSATPPVFVHSMIETWGCVAAPHTTPHPVPAGAQTIVPAEPNAVALPWLPVQSVAAIGVPTTPAPVNQHGKEEEEATVPETISFSAIVCVLPFVTTTAPEASRCRRATQIHRRDIGAAYKCVCDVVIIFYFSIII